MPLRRAEWRRHGDWWRLTFRAFMEGCSLWRFKGKQKYICCTWNKLSESYLPPCQTQHILCGVSSSRVLFQGSQCFTAGLHAHRCGEDVCIVDADVEIGALQCAILCSSWKEDPRHRLKRLLLGNDHFRCKCSDRNMQGNLMFWVRE